jgi:tRNA threonylcarbamoyladenosine biosynthesis protein TsaE
MSAEAGRRFETSSPEETIAVGRTLATELSPPVVVLLIGDLGAGKTTLTKGIASALNAAAEEDVTSPTFTLVHEYARNKAGGPHMYHVDLYRIENAHELETLGIEDLITDPRAIVVIEWGEKLGASFRNPWPGSGVIEIHLRAVDDNRRIITVEKQTAKP